MNYINYTLVSGKKLIVYTSTKTNVIKTKYSCLTSKNIYFNNMSNVKEYIKKSPYLFSSLRDVSSINATYQKIETHTKNELLEKITKEIN